MTRFTILTLGALALLLLALLCTLYHGSDLQQGLAQRAATSAAADGKLRIAAGRSDGRIHLEGSVPDPRIRDALHERAAAAVGPANVVDELQLDSTPPPAEWSVAALTLIDALASLIDGQGSLNGRSLDVQGVASNAAAAAAARSVVAQTLPDGYEGRASVSSVDETSPVPVAVCAGLLRELLRERIRFSPDSSDIDRSSFSLLDRIAATADRCPEARITISGHTDAQGAPDANRRLSQARAETVRTYLIQTGISPARLVAVGHGDSRPVADNESAEGRVRNRRIEFEVQ